MSFAAYRDIGVLICEKQVHVRKVGGCVFRSFIVTPGDIPGFHFNSITGKAEEVVNLRGRAYAARRRRCYRKKKGQK